MDNEERRIYPGGTEAFTEEEFYEKFYSKAAEDEITWEEAAEQGKLTWEKAGFLCFFKKKPPHF